MKITDIPNTLWRDQLLPASFRGAFFHVETGSRENGRAIVVHEFPKKDVPYPEDMGRKAMQFTVRAYCIAYPIDTSEPLYQRDYRAARNILITALEQEGPGVLQLPTINPMMVVCPQYRWTEEERFGGFCTFDLSFVEYGVPPGATAPSSYNNLLSTSFAARDRIMTVMSGVEADIREKAGLPPRITPPLPPQIAPGP
jgi:hypothetical protein